MPALSIAFLLSTGLAAATSAGRKAGPCLGESRTRALAFAFFCSLAVPIVGQASDSLDLALPTGNDALFRGDGPAFYQVIERNFHGEESTPWQGGRYGFVRDPVETAGGLVYSRFHEGIDIRPMQRDAEGEPLDAVCAIAPGRVVHANEQAGYSNYGRYVVVEHRWDGCSYYSLYAHLNRIMVEPGQKVERGTQLGVMGHTGTGINRERAHVHLELNMMLNRQFQGWYDIYFRNDPNRHGIYNGMNLVGLDIARLYLELRKRPSLTIPEFVAQESTFYKVALPKSGHLDLPKLYPWLLTGAASWSAKSWEVSFSQSGVPLKIEPGRNEVREAQLTYCRESRAPYADLTREVVGGRGEHARLTESGRRLMRLLIFPD